MNVNLQMGGLHAEFKKLIFFSYLSQPTKSGTNSNHTECTHDYIFTTLGNLREMSAESKLILIGNLREILEPDKLV